MKTVSVDRLLQHYVLVDGMPFGEGNAVVCAHFSPAFEAGAAASQVFWFYDGEWHVGPMLGQEAVSLALDPGESRAWVLGREGQWAAVTPQGIERQGSLVSLSIGPFRRIRLLGATPVLLGESRTIFAIIDWVGVRLNDDAPSVPPADDEMELVEAIIEDGALLFDIDGIGTGRNEHVAVGSDGLLVTLAGRSLETLPSLTNLPLYAIHHGEPGGDYIVGGHDGMLLRGKDDIWEEWPMVEGALDLSSVASFAGRVWACDGQSVFVGPPGQRLQNADFGVGSPVPAHALRTDGFHLLSIAGKELFLSRDGTTWQDLLPRR
jgi:hypothetical protein